MTLGDNNTGDILDIDTDIDAIDQVSDKLVLAQLVCSSTNLIVIFIYWTYLLYASISRNSSSWPPMFPHLVLAGVSVGSASNLASVTLASYCHSSLLLPVSYSSLYSCMLVRLVYLHSVHRDMYKLSSLYQTLLLVFSILVQISLTLQSMMLNNSSNQSYCPIYSSTIMDLICFSYSLFLLLTITVISIVLRKRKEHRREARAIWLYSLLSLAVWIAWISVSLVYQEYYIYIKGLGLEGTVTVLFIIFLLPKSRRLTLIGKIYEPRHTNIPVFGYPRHNTFSTMAPSHSHMTGSSPISHGSSSYLGFHRPTRVIPPTSSHTSSKSSSSPSYSYHPRLQPWFLQPSYRRFDKSGKTVLLNPAAMHRNYNYGMFNRNYFSGYKNKNYYDDYTHFHDKYNFGL